MQPRVRHRSHRTRSPAYHPSVRVETDRAATLLARFNRVRREDRAGVTHFRRYKCAALNVLEHFLYLCNLLANISYPNTSRRLLRRTNQIQQKIYLCQANKLPPRDECLLKRLEKEDESSDDDDSILAETLVFTSESESELETIDQRHTGVWASGRYTSVKVTSSNPLLRTNTAAASTLDLHRRNRQSPPVRHHQR